MQFLSISEDTLLNVDRIRLVKIVGTFECEVWFDQNHSIQIHGDAAQKLLNLLEKCEVKSLPNNLGGEAL